MRSADANTINSSYDAPVKGQITRDLGYVFARDLDDDEIVPFGFWTGLETETISVIDRATGDPVSRVYVGEGSVLSVGSVPLATGLNVRSLDITLSGIHPEVQLMVRGHKVRLCKIEVHRARFDPVSRALVGPPVPHFEGEINDVDYRTPTPGGAGGVTLKCVDHTINLTRANHKKRSHAAISQRSGDGIGKYLDIMGAVQVPWGNVESEQKSKNSPSSLVSR